jgi:ABC-type polar amino acid transport system ATPase subunit
VEFDQVDKYFGDTHVLKDVSLDIEEGDVTVVIGPSGSGKSTLLRCANRLEEIQGGEIRLDGQSISSPDADIDRLRQRIGMVFQSFNLFPHKTALENVTLAPRRCAASTNRRPASGPSACSTRSVSESRRRRTRTSSPAASSSASPSPARSRWTRG